MLETFTFYATLAVSINLGSYYKKIEDLEVKKNYGVGIGIIIACLICGAHIFHTMLMVWGNIIIIKCSDRRYIHQMCFGWTWLYLLYMHINLLNACYAVWLNQTIALRLVGIAFEIHCNDKTSTKASSSISTDSDHNIVIEPTVSDIVSYAFFFIGMHKGPYYRWKIYNDHLSGSYGILGDYRIITEQNLKKMFCCVAVYFLLRMKFSPRIYHSDSFYTGYYMDARYLYNTPLLLMYFLQTEIIMLLSTCVCTEAGFGVYPAVCQPLPGQGPSVRNSFLKLAISPKKGLDEEYTFSMLKCFEHYQLVVGPRMNDTLKGWDMSTRYWFWAYIYKNLLKSNHYNKEARRLCSYLAWTLWSGPSLQQLLISSTLWVHTQLETEYDELYDASESMKAPWDIGFSMMRMFCLIYLTPCFIVYDAATLLKYYNSIFWVYHILLLVLIIGAIVIYKSKTKY